MTAIADYASFYETRVRGRRRALRYLGVLAVWSALFVVRPNLALAIWRERFTPGGDRP
ncbi:MAG: hypothetical protein JWQ46_1000 [Phenylobacterium sp.]|jgi:hypothetical protein|nr:hypothetical protein [Phenylobacterium sp.]MDB5466238.1 hypothetical protein [Phenylobacterium sp.]